MRCEHNYTGTDHGQADVSLLDRQTPIGHLATNPIPALAHEKWPPPAGFASLLANSVTNAQRRPFLFI